MSTTMMLYFGNGSQRQRLGWSLKPQYSIGRSTTLLLPPRRYLTVMPHFLALKSLTIGLLLTRSGWFLSEFLATPRILLHSRSRAQCSFTARIVELVSRLKDTQLRLPKLSRMVTRRPPNYSRSQCGQQLVPRYVHVQTHMHDHQPTACFSSMLLRLTTQLPTHLSSRKLLMSTSLLKPRTISRWLCKCPKSMALST